MSNGVKAILIMATPVVVIGGGVWILGVKPFITVITILIILGFLVWIWSMIKGVMDDHDHHRAPARAEVPTQMREPWPQPSPLVYDLVEGLGQETQVIEKVTDDRA